MDRPKPWTILRAMLRRARSNRSVAAHLAAVLASFCFNYVRLLLSRRPAVSIALVEHMGDVLAAEPVARFARATMPHARVRWFVRRPY